MDHMDMTTKRPRIAVLVTEEVHATLMELSHLTGKSAAGMVSRMLTDALPGLRSLVASARAFKDKDVQQGVVALQDALGEVHRGAVRADDAVKELSKGSAKASKKLRPSSMPGGRLYADD